MICYTRTKNEPGIFAILFVVVCFLAGIQVARANYGLGVSRNLRIGYDIRDFGATGDGCSVNTSSIQQAIDACSKNGGGKVLISGPNSGVQTFVANVDESVRISFVNYFDVPIYSTVVEFDAEVLYRASGIQKGRPVKLIALDGQIIPLLYNDEKNKLYAYLALDSREKMVAEIKPATNWASEANIKIAKWDKGKQVGRIVNGLLSVIYNKEGIQINYYNPLTEKPSKAVISNLIFKGWIDDGDNGMLDENKARELGLSRIEMQKADIIEAFVDDEKDRSILTVRKRYNSGLCKNLIFEEIISLFDYEPKIEYRIKITNKGSDALYLANLTGTESKIFGSYEDLLKSSRLILLRDSENPRSMPPIMILSNEGSPNDALKPSQGWKRRMAYVEAENGYGLGTSMIFDQVLSPQWHRWHNGLNSFGLVTTTTESSLPVQINKEQTIELGGVLLLTNPGSNGFDGIRKIHDNYLEGKPYFLRNSIAAWHAEKIMSVPNIQNFDEDFCDFNRWKVIRGEISKLKYGIQLQKEITNAEIITAFRFYGDWPFKAFISIENLSREALIEVNLTSISDNDITVNLKSIKNAGTFSFLLNEEARNLLNDGCKLSIILKGKSKSIVDIKEFKIIPDIQIPSPLYPENNEEITDLSTSFVWKPQQGIASYNIQIATDPKFDSITFYGPTQLPKSHRMDGFSHYATNLLKPGKYYWRLNAVGIDGTASVWSENSIVYVNDIHPVIRPGRIINPENPLILFDTWRINDISGFRNFFSDELIPYVAFAPTALPHNEIPVKNLQVANEIGIPYFMQVWTPLCLLEKIFKENENVLGVFWGEQIGDMERFKRVAALCAKYGKYCMFFDGAMHNHQWQHLFSDPEITDFLRKHKENIIFGHKTNITDLAPVVMGTISGGWLDGLFVNLGMMFEAFYWDHAGYRIELDRFYGKRGGKANLMPPNFWNQQFMMAISQGVTILNVGGQGNTTIDIYDPKNYPEFWFDPDGAAKNPSKRYTAIFDRAGKPTPVWNYFVKPYLEAIIKHQMIPTKEEVLQNINMTVLLDKKPVQGELHHSKYGIYQSLIQNTFGINSEGAEINDLIPNSGRYFWIPIMPYNSNGLIGKNNITISELQDTIKVKNIVDQFYPKWYTGDAWVCQLNNKFYVSSTRENGSTVQSFKFSLNSEKFMELEGEIGPHKYIMGKIKDEGNLWFQANTQYPKDDTKLVFNCSSKPSVQVSPAKALKGHHWDEKSYRLNIVLSHEEGVVEVILKSNE